MATQHHAELTDAMQRFLQPGNLEYVLEIEAQVQKRVAELAEYKPDHKSFSPGYKPHYYVLPILLGEHLGLTKEDVMPAIVAGVAIRMFMSYADDLIDEQGIDPQTLIKPFIDGLEGKNTEATQEAKVCYSLGRIIYEGLKLKGSRYHCWVTDHAKQLENKFYEAHSTRNPEEILEVSGSLSNEFCFTLIGVGMDLEYGLVEKLESVGYNLGTYLQLADDLVDLEKDRATNQPNYMATILPEIRQTILHDAKRKALQTLDILPEGMKKDIEYIVTIASTMKTI